jgi:hypothetical protein
VTRDPPNMAFLPADIEKQLRQKSYVYNKLVLDLHEITFAGFLLKYARKTACRIYGREE